MCQQSLVSPRLSRCTVPQKRDSLTERETLPILLCPDLHLFKEPEMCAGLCFPGSKRPRMLLKEFRTRYPKIFLSGMLTVSSYTQQSLFKNRRWNSQIPMWKGIWPIWEGKSHSDQGCKVETQRILYKQSLSKQFWSPFSLPSEFGYFPTIASLFNLIEIL